MCSVWPKETSPASKSASEVTLIALYDVGVHGGHLAPMALFQRFSRTISRTKRLMMDVSSSVGEVVMLGAGSIEHRELIYYTIQKSTTFEPPRSGPRQGMGKGGTLYSYIVLFSDPSRAPGNALALRARAHFTPSHHFRDVDAL